MSQHAKLAKTFLAQSKKADWHDKTLWKVRKLRDKVSGEVDEFQELREMASQIKKHTLTHLDEYLLQFERKAQGNGIVVHWARDAREHNEIVHGLLKEKKITQVIKSKSMLTEECELNRYLKERNVNVLDSDLGELIVQLRRETPSHIVMPAIHLNKEQVGEVFLQEKLMEEYSNDPQYLTFRARTYLRDKFLNHEASLTGVNFAIAETGGIVVVTNEGNADLGVNLAKINIHCMGIEKIIPSFKNLEFFIRLLARSATGQPISVYTSHYHKPRPEQARHIVILDNRRSDRLGEERFYEALKCIRCGACMNTCPVYRNSGGHSYTYPIPGPIGSILAPKMDLKKHRDLPFASSLCGSCTYVCPVKINLHQQLFDWREEIAKSDESFVKKKYLSYFLVKLFSRHFLTKFFFGLLKWLLRVTPKTFLKRNNWGKYREFPKIPQESFAEWYSKNGKNFERET